MQDLVQLLKDKAELTDEQAVKALQVMREYIESKVPPMMKGMVENFLGKQFSDSDKKKAELKAEVEAIAAEAKNKIEDLSENAREEAETFAKEASEKIGEWADKTEVAAKEAIDKLKGMIEENKKVVSNTN